MVPFLFVIVAEDLSGLMKKDSILFPQKKKTLSITWVSTQKKDTINHRGVERGKVGVEVTMEEKSF